MEKTIMLRRVERECLSMVTVLLYIPIVLDTVQSLFGFLEKIFNQLIKSCFYAIKIGSSGGVLGYQSPGVENGRSGS